MKGNKIVLTMPQQGNESELIVPTGETWYPGMIVQLDASVALKHGVHTGAIYNRDADGDRPKGGWYVVTERNLALRGLGITDLDTFDSYAAGDQASVYKPQNGDELNLLYKNVTGTADDVAVNDLLIVDDGTGKMIVTTGSPETEVAMALEALVDPTADTLIHCSWSGV